MLFRSKVKTIKARPPLGSHRGIMFSQPTHEGVHIGIAPNPCWKTLKGGLAIWSGRAVADIAVDACGVRPISFDRDDGKAMLGKQVPGNGGSCAVEFGRSVARLAQQHNPCERQNVV